MALEISDAVSICSIVFGCVAAVGLVLNIWLAERRHGTDSRTAKESRDKEQERWETARTDDLKKWKLAREEDQRNWEAAEKKRDEERSEERARWKEDRVAEKERWEEGRDSEKENTQREQLRLSSEEQLREKRWLAGRQIAVRLDLIGQIQVSVQECLDISGIIERFISDPDMEMTSRIAWARSNQNQIIQLQAKFVLLTSYMPLDEAKNHMLLIVDAIKWMASLYEELTDRNVPNDVAATAFEKKSTEMAEKFIPIITVLNRLNTPSSLRSYYDSFALAEDSILPT